MFVNVLSIFYVDLLFLQFWIEYIYFIVAVENAGSKSRNVQPMNKGLPKLWPYFPASLLYFLSFKIDSTSTILPFLSFIII